MFKQRIAAQTLRWHFKYREVHGPTTTTSVFMHVKNLQEDTDVHYASKTLCETTFSVKPLTKHVKFDVENLWFGMGGWLAIHRL